MNTAVVQFDARPRKPPTWNPEKPRHSWSDVAGTRCKRCGLTPEGEHACGFCGVVYHSAPEGSGWVKHWTLYDAVGNALRSGKVRQIPPCPGRKESAASAEARSDPAALPPSPAVEPMSASVESVAGEPCCRCRPPLPTCGLPTQFYPGSWMCAEQAAAAARARAGAA
jgi:hypothetical protein